MKIQQYVNIAILNDKNFDIPIKYCISEHKYFGKTYNTYTKNVI